MGGEDLVMYGGLAFGVVAMVVVSRAARAAVTRALDRDEAGPDDGRPPDRES